LGEYRLQGHLVDGTELFDVTYEVGSRLVINSLGEEAEQIVVVVGKGVRSVHASPDAKPVAASSSARGNLPGQAGPSRMNFNLLLGSRRLDDNWEPVDESNALGFRFDHAFRDWPVHLVWGLHLASEDGEDMGPPFNVSGDVELNLAEFSIGVMKVWDRAARFRPYVSAGASLIQADLETELYDDNDESLGLFVEVGVFWQLARGFNIGLDTRHLLLTDLEIGPGPAEVDVNSFQVSVLLGWGW
jgi:hypothetical protein